MGHPLDQAKTYGMRHARVYFLATSMLVTPSVCEKCLQTCLMLVTDFKRYRRGRTQHSVSPMTHHYLKIITIPLSTTKRCHRQNFILEFLC